MAERNFMEMLCRKWDERKYVCVGLDSDSDKIPKNIVGDKYSGILQFNFKIIEATHDLVCAYKPNIAFYESLGAPGIAILKMSAHFIKLIAPDVPIIGDIKRGDMCSTNLEYVKAAFEYFGFDAVTIHNYLGQKAMQPFLDMKNKGIFVLCRTSNEGADEFQDVNVIISDRQVPFYQHVAHRIANFWNQNKNCGLVVGATYPEELAQVRAIVGDEMPLLIPGVGNQGGDVKKTVKAAQDRMIINASRSIIFASSGPDFAKAARKATIKLQKEIGRHLL